MIIEAIVGSLTVLIVSSLWFVDRILKRDHQDDEEFAEDAEDIVPLIRPFMQFFGRRNSISNDGTLCPICKIQTCTWSQTPTGIIKCPVLCQDKECPVTVPHLNVECVSCGSKWKMATADSVIKK